MKFAQQTITRKMQSVTVRRAFTIVARMISQLFCCTLAKLFLLLCEYTGSGFLLVLVLC